MLYLKEINYLKITELAHILHKIGTLKWNMPVKRVESLIEKEFQKGSVNWKALTRSFIII